MGKKLEIALGIALQTHVLRICPLHDELYFVAENDDDDANMARAFAVAVELVRQHETYAEEFDHDEHQLTDLLSQTIAEAPPCCPGCLQPQINGRSSGACVFH